MCATHEAPAEVHSKATRRVFQVCTFACSTTGQLCDQSHAACVISGVHTTYSDSVLAAQLLCLHKKANSQSTQLFRAVCCQRKVAIANPMQLTAPLAKSKVYGSS